MDITVQELADAIRKNGFEQTFSGSWIVPKDGEKHHPVEFGANLFDIPPEDVDSACAIGQAALNLKVRPNAIASAIDNAGGSREEDWYRDYVEKHGSLEFRSTTIIQMNDDQHKSCAEIADHIEANWPLNVILHILHIGD
jgi:hypothetical protein